jgi:hypothetical protein
MKKMIKKRFGWFDIYYAEMLLGVTFAIFYACIGNFGVAFAWIAFVFSWVIFKLIISVENRRYKALVNLSKEIQSKEKKAVQNMVWFCNELQLEMQRHRLTALQGMKYKNKAEFMQRKKSLTQYLKYSDAIDNLYEQEVERLHKMEKEIEKKNNDGKDKGNDSETETAKTE